MSGTITDSTGDTDIFIVCLSASGNIIYFKKDGGSGYQDIKDLAVYNNEAIIAGTYKGSATFSGNELINQSNPYNPQVFFARYSSTGNLNLIKEIISGGYTSDVKRIKTDGNKIYIDGYFADTLSIGNIDTTIILGSISEEEEQLLIFNINGKLVNFMERVGFYFTTMVNFSFHQNGSYVIRAVHDYVCNHCAPAMILSKMDTAATNIWKYESGGGYSYSTPPPSVIAPYDLSSTDSFFYVTGVYVGSSLLGPDSLRNSGMFLIKLDHAGNFLFVKGIEYDIYPWYLSNVHDNSVVVTGKFYGNAYLDNYFLANGTVSSCFVAKFKDSPLNISVEGINRSNLLKLFPNPSTGNIRINFTGKYDSCKIYNSLGEQINFKMTGDEIDITSVPKGMYYVEILVEGKKTMKKIIVE